MHEVVAIVDLDGKLVKRGCADQSGDIHTCGFAQGAGVHADQTLGLVTYVGELQHDRSRAVGLPYLA